jgi:hypothetical protein
VQLLLLALKGAQKGYYFTWLVSVPPKNAKRPVSGALMPKGYYEPMFV